MRRNLIYIFILLGYVFTLNGEPSVRTNVELINDIATHIASQCMDSFPVQKGDTVAVEVSRTSSPMHDQFNEHILLSFIEQGIIIIKSDSIPSVKHLTMMPASRMGVFYTERFRQRFWGKQLIKREGFAEINIRYDNGRNKPISNEMFSHTLQDTIPAQMKMFVEQNGLFPGTVSFKNKNTLAWLEPFIAVLITGIVSYMFYTIRSE